MTPGDPREGRGHLGGWAELMPTYFLLPSGPPDLLGFHECPKFQVQGRLILLADMGITNQYGKILALGKKN